MANSFNPVQEMQFSQLGQQKLSNRDKFLIEALLSDSGVLDMVAAPTPSPGPLPVPSPSPSPSPAPAPAPSPTQGSGSTVNVFLQLALAKVRAGDLITADFANSLVDALLALDARLRVLEGQGRTTPVPASPAPSPSPTPSPTPGSEVSLTGGGRVEASRAAPTIESAAATTVRGKGVTIEVTGDNMGENVVERVMLGAAQIPPKAITFKRTGFSFTTTQAVVEKSRNRLTVVTSGGEDSAALTPAGKKAPVL
jgi:hypothetical protein